MRACFSGQVPDSEPLPEGPGRQRGLVEPGFSEGGQAFGSWMVRAWGLAVQHLQEQDGFLASRDVLSTLVEGTERGRVTLTDEHGASLDDGLLARESGSWAADKLAILRCYFPAFGRACRKRVNGTSSTASRVRVSTG